MPIGRPHSIVDRETLIPDRARPRASGSGGRIVLDKASRAPWTFGPSYRGRLDLERTPVFTLPVAGEGELYMGTSGLPLPGAGTFFIGAIGDQDRTEAELLFVHGGSLSSFGVSVGKAPGVGNSWQFTVLVNGSPTSMAVTIAGAARQAAYGGPLLTVPAMALVVVQRDASGLGTAPLTVANWTAIFSPS